MNIQDFIDIIGEAGGKPNGLKFRVCSRGRQHVCDVICMVQGMCLITDQHSYEVFKEVDDSTVMTTADTVEHLASEFVQNGVCEVNVNYFDAGKLVYTTEKLDLIALDGGKELCAIMWDEKPAEEDAQVQESCNSVEDKLSSLKVLCMVCRAADKNADHELHLKTSSIVLRLADEIEAQQQAEFARVTVEVGRLLAETTLTQIVEDDPDDVPASPCGPAVFGIIPKEGEPPRKLDMMATV